MKLKDPSFRTSGAPTVQRDDTESDFIVKKQKETISDSGFNFLSPHECDEKKAAPE